MIQDRRDVLKSVGFCAPLLMAGMGGAGRKKGFFGLLAQVTGADPV